MLEPAAVPGERPSYYVGHPMPFPSEQDAVDFTAAALNPFCKSIVREPQFPCGLRPDLGIRLKSLPDIPIAIEVKRWRKPSAISPFPDAVAQAAEYAQRTEYAAFVGPFQADNMSGLMQPACRFESGILVAGQLSVGVVWFSRTQTYNQIGGLCLGGVQVAHFLRNAYGEPETRLHSDAQRLLTIKKRLGSRSWR